MFLSCTDESRAKRQLQLNVTSNVVAHLVLLENVEASTAGQNSLLERVHFIKAFESISVLDLEPLRLVPHVN